MDEPAYKRFMLQKHNSNNVFLYFPSEYMCGFFFFSLKNSDWQKENSLMKEGILISAFSLSAAVMLAWNCQFKKSKSVVLPAPACLVLTAKGSQIATTQSIHEPLLSAMENSPSLKGGKNLIKLICEHSFFNPPASPAPSPTMGIGGGRSQDRGQ